VRGLLPRFRREAGAVTYREFFIAANEAGITDPPFMREPQMNAEVVRQEAGQWLLARGWRQKLAKARPHEPSKMKRFEIYVRRDAPRDGLQGTLRPAAGRP
jgi:hypothetical protein